MGASRRCSAARNGGALGSFATAQGGTLTGTISNLRGAVLDFVTSIDDIENLPGIRALKDTLNGIVDALTGSGPTAERLRNTFSRIVDQASQFVADLGGGRDGAAALMGRMLDAAERLWLNSACDWGHSEPLAVPRAALEMRRRGHSPAAVDALVYGNPVRFLSQAPGFRVADGADRAP